MEAEDGASVVELVKVASEVYSQGITASHSHICCAKTFAFFLSLASEGSSCRRRSRPSTKTRAGSLAALTEIAELLPSSPRLRESKGRSIQGAF